MRIIVHENAVGRIHPRECVPAYRVNSSRLTDSSANTLIGRSATSSHRDRTGHSTASNVEALRRRSATEDATIQSARYRPMKEQSAPTAEGDIGRKHTLNRSAPQQSDEDDHSVAAGTKAVVQEQSEQSDRQDDRHQYNSRASEAEESSREAHD